MKIIRTKARLFQHILPLIKEEESKGHAYIRDADDGTVVEGGQNQICVKVVHFDDGKPEVSFEDRTLQQKVSDIGTPHEKLTVIKP